MIMPSTRGERICRVEHRGGRVLWGQGRLCQVRRWSLRQLRGSLRRGRWWRYADSRYVVTCMSGHLTAEGVEDETRNVFIPHLHHLHVARTSFSVSDNLQVYLPWAHRSGVHLIIASMHSRWLKARASSEMRVRVNIRTYYPLLDFSLKFKLSEFQ